MNKKQLRKLLKELCEAVPSVFKWNDTVAKCMVVEFVGTEDGIWGKGLELYLPVISQRAIQWASKRNWAPFNDDEIKFSVGLEQTFGPAIKVDETKQYEFNLSDINSEPIARIKAVIEMADLLEQTQYKQTQYEQTQYDQTQYE